MMRLIERVPISITSRYIKVWRVVGTLGLAVLTLLWLTHLNTPAPWWDEGWTLTVARNWVEHGVYGMQLLGEPASPGLAASFPNVVSIAISFQIFGVGIWQGRLPAALYTLASFGLLYHLGQQLYNRSIAIGALVVLILTSTHLATNPLFIGRQVLAEPLMIFFLLAGYVALLASLRRSLWWFPLALLMWGLALNAKGQTLPFWAVSLVVPLVFLLVRQCWRSALVVGLALPGSYAVSLMLLRSHALLNREALLATELVGLREAVAIVPVASARSLALTVALVAGLPVLLGLAYTTWRWLAGLRNLDLNDGCEMVRLALLALAGSWFGWYLLLSVGWARYLYPALFIGSIFAAAFFYDMIDGYNLRSSLNRVSAALRRFHLDRRSLQALLTLLMITATAPITLQQLYNSYTGPNTTSLQQVAGLLNTSTPPDTVIESYDSELFFLLDRPYHFPPDQINVDLIRRGDLAQEVHTIYDPLAADPSYLVLGPFSRASELYDGVLKSGAFRLVQQYGTYEIYERVR